MKLTIWRCPFHPNPSAQTEVCSSLNFQSLDYPTYHHLLDDSSPFASPSGSSTSHAPQAAKLNSNARHDTVPPPEVEDDHHPENSPPLPIGMRAKLTLKLDEHLQGHPDIAAHLERTLSIEGSSPKPCIVPGNALQLIDDDPETSHPHTPSSVIILGNEDSHTFVVPGSPPTPDTSSAEPDHEHDHEHENDPQSEQDQDRGRRPIPRVRFRSRVRITSGLKKHRHSTGNPNSTSPSSSASGSPSSSISAPLRWQADENASWGPLGRRLNAYGGSNTTSSQRRASGGKQERERERGMAARSAKLLRPDERTPLIRSGRPGVSYTDHSGDEGGSDDAEVNEDEEPSSRAAALRREEEQVFGRWPWRLFNRHVSSLTLLLTMTKIFMLYYVHSGGGGTLSLSCVVVVPTSLILRNDSALSWDIPGIVVHTLLTLICFYVPHPVSYVVSEGTDDVFSIYNVPHPRNTFTQVRYQRSILHSE